MSAAPARRLDLAGLALSGLCLAHCLAVPLVATGALAWAASERVHGVLIVAVAAVVVGVAVPGVRRTRRPLVPVLLVGGLALLAAALVAGEARETALTVAGSLALASGHLLNLRP